MIEVILFSLLALEVVVITVYEILEEFKIVGGDL